MLMFTLVFTGALLVLYVEGQGLPLSALLDLQKRGGTGNRQPAVKDSKPLSCECVPYYLCKNREPVVDIRNRNSSCYHYLDVCCPEPITTPVQPPRSKRNIKCGDRHPEGVGFKIEGDIDNETQFGEFPWMVAILREETLGDRSKKQNVYKCGGSLIHQQMVLTAAHCVHKAQDRLKIRAGEWDTQTEFEVLPHQDRNVTKVIIHPQYRPGTLYNDVALLLLNMPVALGDNVNVVCLPKQDQVFDGSRCFTGGWGEDNFEKEDSYQVILKKFEVPVVPRKTCIDLLRKRRKDNSFELHESFICAGGEDKVGCKGDGGSPLVCPSPHDHKQYQQVGIVSWSADCDGDNIPRVYANVAKLHSWIDEQMKANKLRTG